MGEINKNVRPEPVFEVGDPSSALPAWKRNGRKPVDLQKLADSLGMESLGTAGKAVSAPRAAVAGKTPPAQQTAVSDKTPLTPRAAVAGNTPPAQQTAVSGKAPLTRQVVASGKVPLAQRTAVSHKASGPQQPGSPASPRKQAVVLPWHSPSAGATETFQPVAPDALDLQADTSILSIEKGQRKFKLTLEDGTVYYLIWPSIKEKGLFAGMPVNSEAFRKWVAAVQFAPALNAAIAMLAARDCATQEIKQKLSRYGYCRDAVLAVLKKLKADHLLNDVAFTAGYIAQRTDRSYGPRRIEMDLRKKGISAEDARQALESLDEEKMLEQALTIARKYWDRRDNDDNIYKTREKAMAAIVRRGYSWDIAHQAWKAVQEEE